MQTLKSWLQSIEKLRKYSIKELSETYFHQDPMRPIYSDSDYFFSPADGIILYQKEVNPNECIVEIKGKNYTLQDALQNKDFDKRCLIIGIFMTMFDVHVNRIPLNGFLTYKHLDTIESYNWPMLDEEQTIFKNILDIDKCSYLFNNERVLNTVYCPILQQKYYILQIADYDIDTIVHFTKEQNEPFHQNERFSIIRYGSQVDLIIPVNKKYRFKLLCKEKYHVEAGLDKLVKIIPAEETDYGK